MEDVGASSGATMGVSDKIPKNQVVEANQFSLDQKFHLGKDPKKLKRMMDNRVYSRKYKQKKAQFVVELEKRTRALETKVALLRSKVEACQNQKLSLEIEQQTLKVQIVRREKERLIREEEIEKNKAEVKKHHELLSTQLQALGQMALNCSSATVNPASSSNSIPFSGSGQMVSGNSVQDPNGGEISKERNNAEELAKYGLTFQVKPEPEA